MATEWLRRLEVGSPVIMAHFRGYGEGTQLYLTSVTRLTKSRVMIQAEGVEIPFSRNYGWLIGSEPTEYSRHYLTEATDAMVAKAQAQIPEREREALDQRLIKAIPTLTPEQKKRIAAIIDEDKK